MPAPFTYKGVAVASMTVQQAQAALNEILAQIEAAKSAGFVVATNVAPT